MPCPCHALTMSFFSRPQHSTAVSRRPCCGLEKNGMVGAWHGHAMASVNQTRPHCVNHMGKTHSKPLPARHGRGTAWERHAMCESALIGSSKVFQVVFVHLVYNPALILTSYWCPFLLNVVSNLIYIFLFSRQLVLLAVLPTLIHPFCGQMGVPGCFSDKFHPDVTVVYPFF